MRAVIGKNRIGRIITLTLSALIIMSSIISAAGYDNAFAQSKPAKAKAAISRTRLTMKPSGTAALKVKNYGKKKVKWSSSNTRIVKIRKKSGRHRQTAVLKAGKKTGTCTIKAKVGKKTLKCRVTVKKVSGSSPVKPVSPEETSPEIRIEVLPISDSSKDMTAGIPYDPSEISMAAGSAAEFSDSFAGFSLDLLRQTRKHELSQSEGSANSNILISPDSVLTALIMTGNGAAGQTLSQIQGLYGGPASADMMENDLAAIHKRLTGSTGKDDIIYKPANSIWVRDDGQIDVNKEFLKKNKALHNAEYYMAPFTSQTVTDMNNWVYNNTRNMIKQIVSRLEPETVMVLINAIAFEGRWAEPFRDYQINSNGKFTDASGTAQKATMLSGRAEGSKSYIEMKGGKGFIKMYQGGKTAFVGILPPDGMTTDKYLNSLTGDDFISSWNNRTDKYTVDFMMPEFKYDYSCSMKDVLRSMGMTRAFTDFAEFSGMITDKSQVQDLKVGDVLHKTHIELDRNGTRAAAATAVMMEKSSAYIDKKEKKTVYLDRPFIYAIVDTETGIPLFIGMVNTIK